MKQIKRTYAEVPQETLGQFLDDLHADLRDLPHAPPRAAKQADGKFKVEVTIGDTDAPRPASRPMGRYS